MNRDTLDTLVYHQKNIKIIIKVVDPYDQINIYVYNILIFFTTYI